MAYTVLQNKYRPQKLSDLCGQEHVVKTFKNCIKRGTIPNAFLFTGLRGSGKTSTARIVASMLNCEKGVTLDPCGKCPACLKIKNGTSIDFQEIDAASNNGIDNVRLLKESAQYAPTELRNKIVILDECHRLTPAASEALLKLLEEPPSYMYFFLCTTEPREILSTIQSRCQRYDFKKLIPGQIYNHLKLICKKEDIGSEDGALRVLSKISGGSMRDAIKNLESLKNYCEDDLNPEDAYQLFGVPDSSFATSLVDKIIDKNVTEGMVLINESVDSGANPELMIKDVSMHIRDLLVLRTCKAGADSLVESTGNMLEKLKSQASRINVVHLLEVQNIFNKAVTATTYNLNPQYVMEKALIESIVYLFTEERMTARGGGKTKA
jgi:DNA polymerase-3 subunit gamma/tau